MKPIEGYPNYAVTEDGRVFSLNYNHTGKCKELKQYNSLGGYLIIDLWRGRKKCRKNVHRLIAETLIPNPEGKRTVNHINCDKTDNRVSNLEWATDGENIRHAYANGLMPVGGARTQAKLTNEQVLDIRRRLADGERPMHLASEYNVSRPVISSIKHRRYWSYI